MHLPYVAIPFETMQDLLSKNPERWQCALIAVAIANDRFSEEQIMLNVCFYKGRIIQ